MSESDWAILQSKSQKGEDFSGDIIDIHIDIKSSKQFARFNGILNGNGHTITSAGLIDTLLEEGEIHDLTVYFPTNIRTESGNPIGGIANTCHGLIHECTAKVKIYQTIENKNVIAGGVAGKISATGRVVMCRNEGMITGYVVDSERVYFTRAGGIAGWNLGLIAGCTNIGTIKGTSYSTLMLGGIVGHADGTASAVEGCTNQGRVQGSITRTESSAYIYGRVGGVIGYAQKTRIIAECFNSGYVTTNVDHVGGIVGVGSSTSLVNCANSGEILNQQSYYYSCAGGICSFFQGDGVDKSIFLNCINTGKVTSLTNPQFTATAGGVCPNLYDCSFGNTLNFGKVTAEGNTKFIFDNISQDRCSAIHIAKSIADANAYATKSRTDQSMPWLLSWTSENASATLSGNVCQALFAYPGMIECYVTKSLSDTHISAGPVSSGKAAESDIENGHAVLSNLSHNTDYCVEWQNKFGETIFRKQIHTANVTFETTVTDIHSNYASASTKCNTKGLNIKSRCFSYGNASGLISMVEANQDFSVRLTNLKEETQHFIIPVLHLAGGATIEGPTEYFNTPKLQPVYQKVEMGPDWITLRLLNRDELNNAGIEIFGPSSFFQDNGEIVLNYLQGDCDEITLPDLKTRRTGGGNSTYPEKQSIGTFIYRNGKKESINEIMVVELPHEVMDSKLLAVSPTYVMVRGVCDVFSTYLKRLNILHISDEQTQEYATVSNPLGQQCFYSMFTYEKGHKYLVALERARNSYSWDYSTLTPRLEIDVTETDCPIVPPYLLLPQITYSAKDLYMKGLYAKGEGNWDIFFEYKETESDNWIKIPPTSKNITFRLNDLAPNKDYHLRLSAYNGDFKISSRTACVSTNGLKYYLPPSEEEKIKADISIPTMDEESGGISYFYNLSGMLISSGTAEEILPRLNKGLYIMRTGTLTKKILVR